MERYTTIVFMKHWLKAEFLSPLHIPGANDFIVYNQFDLQKNGHVTSGYSIHKTKCTKKALLFITMYVIKIQQNEAASNPYSKIHRANMGPTWVLSAPDGPQVGPMKLVILENKYQTIP